MTGALPPDQRCRPCDPESLASLVERYAALSSLSGLPIPHPALR
jgi:hypothetical protein